MTTAADLRSRIAWACAAMDEVSLKELAERAEALDAARFSTTCTRDPDCTLRAGHPGDCREEGP